MRSQEMIHLRLYNQQLTQRKFTKPGELLSWLGAVQAQDYAAAKWAIGSRLPVATDDMIERAIAEKTIIRTWALRATLHFLAPADVRWILQLLSPRLISIHGHYYRKLEIDKKVLSKSNKIILSTLHGGNQLTRPELMAVLKKKGIHTHDLRAGFLLLRAALDGLICFGERKGKQFSYTLLDEWIPATKKINRDEALTELAKRYFTSHGPATAADFAWWSGLTVADVKAALAMAKPYLNGVTINKQIYWMQKDNPALKADPGVHLIPAFDEYLVGYADRSDVLNENIKDRITAASIFKPGIIIRGKTAGTWKRTFKKDAVLIETNLFSAPSTKSNQGLAMAGKQYGKFLQMKVEMK